MINLIKTILPGQTIGIIGGGQLGQMLALAAKEMGYQVGVLDPAPYCSASQVSDFHIESSYDDQDALDELASRCDVITFEFENIYLQGLKVLETDSYLPQGIELLAKTQDRLREKQFIQEAGAEVVNYYAIDTIQDLRNALAEVGYPAVLKTRRFGYDGKGQVVLRSANDLDSAQSLIKSQACILEAWVDYALEVSVMAVGSPRGDLVTFPVAENIHKDNILFQSIVPARIESDLYAQAQSLAKKIAQAGQLVGSLGIEMFVTKEGQILINELAPRPHNSGHYSIEACDFSQFDLHIRSICNLPIQVPELLKPALMVNVLGQDLKAVLNASPSHPSWHLHLYGKGESKFNRKMGHVTLLSQNLEQSLQSVSSSQIWKRG
ncbi:5-(carboxyamino)imidazole ribonucleotide synthase [Hutsoniella sourekii]